MTVQELYDVIGDYNEVKNRLMSDKIIGKIIVKFPMDPSYGQLMDAWEKNDTEEIFKAAHTMKGVCANLALSKLSESAGLITEAFRPGKETSGNKDVTDEVKKLQLQYEEVITAIRTYEAAQ